MTTIISVCAYLNEVGIDVVCVAAFDDDAGVIVRINISVTVQPKIGRLAGFVNREIALFCFAFRKFFDFL